ncbi:MAG: DUF7793 family protein [Pseudobdellovibrio sp.]
MKKLNTRDSAWIVTASGKIRLLQEGIVHVHVNPGHLQTIENAHENLTVAMALCQDTLRCVVLDIRGARPLPKEVRAIYSNPKMAQYFKGLAIVVKTDKISQLMANVYMKVARLPFPMRLCFDFQEGTNWLKKI